MGIEKMNEDGKSKGVEVEQQPGHVPSQYPYGTFQGVANYYQPPPQAPPHPAVGFPRPIAPPSGSSYPNPHYFPPAYQAIPVGYNVIEERWYERERRLPCCGIGMGWFLFMAGFVLGGVPWYVGTFVLLLTHVDYREKPGYIACTIASILAILAVTLGLTNQTYDWW